MIAPTLFLIMINTISNSIPTLSSQALDSVFADDVAVWSTHRSLESASSNVQEALDEIANWCLTWGSEISAKKSSSVVFTKHSTSMPRLRNPLRIGSDEIPEATSHTFLGVVLDTQLRFHIHAQHIRNKATKRLNTLRAVSHTSWGGDRQTLLRI